MKAIKIKDGVYWVGARNPDLRIFDIVMETKYALLITPTWWWEKRWP